MWNETLVVCRPIFRRSAAKALSQTNTDSRPNPQHREATNSSGTLTSFHIILAPIKHGFQWFLLFFRHRFKLQTQLQAIGKLVRCINIKMKCALARKLKIEQRKCDVQTGSASHTVPKPTHDEHFIVDCVCVWNCKVYVEHETNFLILLAQ